MQALFQQGQLEPVTLGMVCSALVRGGRLRSGVEIVNGALNLMHQRNEQPSIQVSIIHSILSSIPMRCVSEEDAARAFVEGLTSLADFSNGESSREYFRRIAVGQVLEYLEEARVAKDRIRNQAPDLLVRQGTCQLDVTCLPGKKTGEVACSVASRASEQETGGRGISGGDLIGISRWPPVNGDAEEAVEAEVVGVLSREIIVKVQDKADSDRLMQPGSRWRMDKMANKVAFARQLKALKLITTSPEGGGQNQQLKQVQHMGGMFGGKKSKGKKDIRPAQEIINALVAPAPPPGQGSSLVVQNCASPCRSMRFDRFLQPPPQDTEFTQGLNSSQYEAVKAATTRRLTLVQGPPGTGKTHTSLRILNWWLRTRIHWPDGAALLATSDTNIAVDNLLEGLIKMGVRAVRLGRPDRIRPELMQYCVDVPQNGETQVDWGMKMRKIAAADVVCSTCVGIGSDQLEGKLFAGVLLDEASQVTEAASLVPLCRGCEQLVLVGDQCQLPPTVASRSALEVGAGEPLFNRLVAAGVTPYMLDTQYRMHPAISQFPADLFYGGRLKDGIAQDHRRAPPGYRWPREDWPVAFQPVLYSRETLEGVSRFNSTEAEEVVRVVDGLLRAQMPPGEIGVVTPYAAQVRVLRRMLRGAVEVSSVDGFQGREKEVIVISTVRSSAYGSVGFLSDWRRVNVAFTRPRSGLIVLGNPETLARETTVWAPWLHWVQCYGVNVMDPVPRGSLDREQLRAKAPSAAMMGLIPTEEDGEAFGSKKGIGKMESAGDESAMLKDARQPQSSQSRWDAVDNSASSNAAAAYNGNGYAYAAHHQHQAADATQSYAHYYAQGYGNGHGYQTQEQYNAQAQQQYEGAQSADPYTHAHYQYAAQQQQAYAGHAPAPAQAAYPPPTPAAPPAPPPAAATPSAAPPPPPPQTPTVPPPPPPSAAVVPQQPGGAASAAKVGVQAEAAVARDDEGRDGGAEKPEEERRDAQEDVERARRGEAEERERERKKSEERGLERGKDRVRDGGRDGEREREERRKSRSRSRGRREGSRSRGEEKDGRRKKDRRSRSRSRSRRRGERERSRSRKRSKRERERSESRSRRRRSRSRPRRDRSRSGSRRRERERSRSPRRERERSRSSSRRRDRHRSRSRGRRERERERSRSRSRDRRERKREGRDEERREKRRREDGEDGASAEDRATEKRSRTET